MTTLAPPLPCPQVVVNVTVEARLQRTNPPKTLAVYSSTAGNTMMRLGFALAGASAADASLLPGQGPAPGLLACR